MYVTMKKKEFTNLFLSCLKNIAVMQEKRLHLIDASRSNENEVENSEKAELQIKGTVSHFPECETPKKRGKDMENYLVPDVILIKQNISITDQL